MQGTEMTPQQALPRRRLMRSKGVKAGVITVAASCALAVLVLAGTARAENAGVTFTPQQRGEIGDIVREYLLHNPDVLRDASAELERRTEQLQRENQAKALAQYWSQLVSPRGATIIGNPNGRVTMVAFFDYNCPYCRASVDDTQKLIDRNPELRVVMRELPILGPDSVEASRVALAVARQTDDAALRGRFYTTLMKSKGLVSGDIALSTATRLGLDGAKIRKAVQDGGADSILQDNLAAAEAVGVTGTPSFIIGDQVVVGAVGVDRIQGAISEGSK
jgi:protein-disulfide isomerase